MKIAVPTYKGGLDDSIFEHFGRAPTFTIYDTETGKVEIVENRSGHFGGMGRPPELLMSLGVNAVICCGMGVKAISFFRSYGIGVYIAPNGLKVKDAIEKFLAGMLVEADESFGCRH